MKTARNNCIVVLAIFALAFTFSAAKVNAQSHAISAEARRVIDHWTKERIQGAIPRDLVIDERGLGYLHKPDGSLQPYGHNIPAKTPNVKPIGGDTTPPEISDMSPDNGETVFDSQQVFSATVTDESGVKSVSFIIISPNGTQQSFTPIFAGNNDWQIALQGFYDGTWGWYVVAKDNAPRGGNTATSTLCTFTVVAGGGGGDEGYITTNSEWTGGGDIQTAAGRLYFEMPSNKRLTRWVGYVCSGTVVDETGTNDRSIIVTASHCVYDDVNKAFARNVLFIPDQAGTSGTRTDLDCSNDPYGCWAPSFGTVDVNWTTRTFPDNVAWDYAYYVVDNSDAHEPGFLSSSNALEEAVYPLPISFSPPNSDDGDPSETSDDFTHALGYSYSEDPHFMYCAEDMTYYDNVNWWLPSCELSGGSSGGPWVQPMDTGTGTGPIISVNSWGFTNQPGMAGPKLSGTSAGCVFDKAILTNLESVSSNDGEAGVRVSCP